MAFSKVSLFFSVLACALFLSSYQVHCIANEDTLLNGINNYRKSLNLSALTKHDKAACLAHEIADGLEDHPCSGAGEFSSAGDPTGAVARLVNFPKLLYECGIEANTTARGAILPACVPRLIDELVVGNYTHSKYAKFLNDSRFSGAGVGSEDDWIVVVLTTEAADGSFSAAAAPPAKGLVILALGFVFVSAQSLL